MWKALLNQFSMTKYFTSPNCGQSIIKSRVHVKQRTPKDAVSSPGVRVKEEDNNEGDDDNEVFCLAAALKSRKQEDIR